MSMFLLQWKCTSLHLFTMHTTSGYLLMTLCQWLEITINFLMWSIALHRFQSRNLSPRLVYVRGTKLSIKSMQLSNYTRWLENELKQKHVCVCVYITWLTVGYTSSITPIAGADPGISNCSSWPMLETIRKFAAFFTSFFTNGYGIEGL